MSITNSTIGQNLIHQMPQPISSAWSLLLRAEDASERIRLCWNVLDTFLRYTTAITLSHYLREPPNPSVEKYLPSLRRPTNGHYCGIIREILRNSTLEEGQFLFHIRNWYFEQNDTPTSNAKELDYFIAMRNRDTHHGARTSDELDGVIEALMNEIQLFLHKAKWLSGYSLYSFSNPSMRRKGGFTGQSFRYHGQNINPLPKQKQWSCRLFPETVYICNPEGTQFLEISPLLILESNRNNRFYLFSSTPKGLRIDGRCTITESLKQHVPKIHNIDVSWDDFLSKRQELDLIAHNTEELFFRIDSFFEIGMIINNRYKIKSRIGTGGMAVVFHAEDQFLEREVALKVLHIEQVDSVSRDRAIKEFLRMTELSHPHIVSVYESVNLADNRVAVSMPLYRGSIKDIFHIHRPTTEQVSTWAQQILSALDHIHTQEQVVIHRDIKPSNIFIDLEGNALLGDFGIAKKDGDTRLTQTSEPIGSKAYMSPEQRNGISEPHNDRYSLGVTLHEIITGTLPTVPGEGIDGDMGTLIKMLTSADPEERMKASWPLPSKNNENTTEPQNNLEEKSADYVPEKDQPKEKNTEQDKLKPSEEEQPKEIKTHSESKVSAVREVPTNDESSATRTLSKGTEDHVAEIKVTEELTRERELPGKNTENDRHTQHKPPSNKSYLIAGIAVAALLGISVALFSPSTTPETDQKATQVPVVKTQEEPVIVQKDYDELWEELNKDIQIGALAIDSELSRFLDETKDATDFQQAGKALQEWRIIAVQKIQDSKREAIQAFVRTYKNSSNKHVLNIVSIAEQHEQKMEDQLNEVFREFDSQKNKTLSKQEFERILKTIRNVPNINTDALERYKKAEQFMKQVSVSIPPDIVLGSYLNIKIQDHFQAVPQNGTEQTISKSGLFGCDKGTSMRGITVSGKIHDSSNVSNTKAIEPNSVFFEASQSTVELLVLSKRSRKESCINNKKASRKNEKIFRVTKRKTIPTKQLQKNTTSITTNAEKISISSKYFALKITKQDTKKIYVFGP